MAPLARPFEVTFLSCTSADCLERSLPPSVGLRARCRNPRCLTRNLCRICVLFRSRTAKCLLSVTARRFPAVIVARG